MLFECIRKIVADSGFSNPEAGPRPIFRPKLQDSEEICSQMGEGEGREPASPPSGSATGKRFRLPILGSGRSRIS